MFSKSSNLLQWVDRVVNETISKDLAEVKKQFHDKYYELKEERMNLIKAKVKEKLGVELEVQCVKEGISFISFVILSCCVQIDSPDKQGKKNSKKNLKCLIFTSVCFMIAGSKKKKKKKTVVLGFELQRSCVAEKINTVS